MMMKDSGWVYFCQSSLFYQPNSVITELGQLTHILPLFLYKIMRRGSQTLLDHPAITSYKEYWTPNSMKNKVVNWWINLPSKTKNQGSS